MPEYTIILAWVHAEKIIKHNLKYINDGGKFVVLCPNIRIIDKGHSKQIIKSHAILHQDMQKQNEINNF